MHAASARCAVRLHFKIRREGAALHPPSLQQKTLRDKIMPH